MRQIVSAEEHVYLLGHATLEECLAFVASESIDGQNVDQQGIAKEWRAANDFLQGLRLSEPAWADNPHPDPIPETWQPFLSEVRTDPIFRRAFSFVPFDFAWVELDRLVVRHKSLNLSQARRAKERLGSKPSMDQVYRLCLPLGQPAPAFKAGRVSDDRFVFVSESNDLRFLECVGLLPEQVSNYHSFGPIAGIVGIAVGYGSNYLNAIACEGRLVLNNGHHRAYALRDLGYTHIPCVIQKVTRREELSVIAAGGLRRNPDAYLKITRPPVLKDYFNPNLHIKVRLPRLSKFVHVSFKIEETEMPA